MVVELGTNRVRTIGWGAAAALLALPLAAMQVTSEVAWSGFDFLVMGLMLASAGGLIELAFRLSGSLAYRAGFGMAVLGGFLLVWVNLAVGIVGDETNPANLLFFALPGFGVLGGLAVRGRPEGMVAVMAGLACLQPLMGYLVIAMDTIVPAPVHFYSVGLATILFDGLWLLSAWLFNRAD